MKELVKLSEKFKLVLKSGQSQANLDNLLKQAIVGDREAWLVFCDLLEEKNPDLIDELRQTRDSGVLAVFSVLSKYFPQIIRLTPTLGLAFNPPLLSKIQAFGRVDTEFSFLYDDYDIEWSPHRIDIAFDKNHPLLDGSPVVRIEGIPNEIVIVRVNDNFEDDDRRNECSIEDYQQQEKLLPIYTAIIAQAKADYLEIIKLFKF